uniref:Uncharacterized protein n=1 Tax=Tanacetum cinerariifolium TaxID=118510 RepID=A0A699JD84_TANCI|nr:hypothetical protein [Tanacetum cinerariifolium]
MFPVTRSIRSHIPLSTKRRPASITPTHSRLPSPPPSRHLLATPPAATPCLGYPTPQPPHHHSRPTNLPPSPPPTPRNATTDLPLITSQPPLATVKAKRGVRLAVISTERVRLDQDSAQVIAMGSVVFVTVIRVRERLVVKTPSRVRLDVSNTTRVRLVL